MNEPRLTVGELKRMLNRYPDEAEVRFTPKLCCSAGWPEFENASVFLNEDDGAVIVMLTEETEEP